VDAFLRLVDPAFDDKVLLEVEAGPEQIAPLEPDVVVLRSFMAERLGRSLETLDIPVVYVDLETPDRYFQDLELVGQLLGNEARAAEIRSFYRVRLDRVDESLQGLAEDQKPRVLLMQYSAQGSEIAFLVPSAEWIQTIETRLAGGIPAWSEAAQAGGWTVVSLEQVAAWDPDQVFVIAYQSASDEVVRKLKSDPQWQGLRAVREASIYGFPADIVSWDQPDPRWILGLTWLAGKMHPAHFPDLDMSWEMAQFFEQLYRMESTVVEQRILPVLKGDLE
jgi:iron complex transport system substrate-binding protein